MSISRQGIDSIEYYSPKTVTIDFRRPFHIRQLDAHRYELITADGVSEIITYDAESEISRAYYKYKNMAGYYPSSVTVMISPSRPRLDVSDNIARIEKEKSEELTRKQKQKLLLL